MQLLAINGLTKNHLKNSLYELVSILFIFLLIYEYLTVVINNILFYDISLQDLRISIVF